MEATREMIRTLASVMCPGAEMVTLTIPGVPQSKARPRFGRGHAYKADRSQERATGMVVRQGFSSPWEGAVAVFCAFYRPDRRRVDLDNLVKHVLDASNRIAFKDDSQVTALAALLEVDRECPRTVVVFARHRGSMERGAPAARGRAGARS